MASVLPDQMFYSLTLQPPTAVTAASTCSVLEGVARNDQQILEARGSRLYLNFVRTDSEGKIVVDALFEQETFNHIRGILTCRVPGESLDHIFLVTDSGRIAMYKYDAENKSLAKVHLETFGKSGIRRTVPGQYHAIDPTGRCLMLASTEKNKVVYMFQRTPDGTMNISSPLEANTPAALTFAICALDVSYENPEYAALEVDYSELEADGTGDAYKYREKRLVSYKVDTGLNHVVKDWSDAIDYTAHKLFTVPGGELGPSGVLVCALGKIYWVRPRDRSLQIQIPRRAGPCEDPDRDTIIVAGALYNNRTSQTWFYYLQTEDGDIFRLTMEYSGTGFSQPKALVLRYLETLPVASHMFILRRGYLYLTGEKDMTKIYQIADLADDPTVEPENLFQSEAAPETGLMPLKLQPTSFRQRGLKYFKLEWKLQSMHPLIKARVDNYTGDDAPQIATIQGSGNKSSFKLTRHGQPVEQLASIKQENRFWDVVFSVKNHSEDEYTAWLIASSKKKDSTMIMKVENENINGVTETPFIKDHYTLLVALMGEDTKVQVHGRGIRSVMADDAFGDWTPPSRLSVQCAGANQRQLLLGLSSGELVFLYMTETGLSELQERPELGAQITAIGLANTPKGQHQARFGVVGCADLTVRVLSIQVENPLEIVSIQAVSDVPVSIVVVEMLDPHSGTTVNTVHIGLRSGVYLRAIIDEVTGGLSEVRSKFLGARPVRIFPVELLGMQCVVLCSSRAWIGYHHPVTKQYTVVPLITPWLSAVTLFKSETSTGVCGVADNELRFIRPTRLAGDKFVTESTPLESTPRAFVRHPEGSVVYVVGSDGNTMSDETAATFKSSSKQEPYLPSAELDNFRAPGHWRSTIQTLDPVAGQKTLGTFHLDNNEAALCCDVVPVKSRDHKYFLIVGTGRNMNTGSVPDPSAPQDGYIRVYDISDDGKNITMVYKTLVDAPVYAVAAYKGRFVVGLKNELVLYDLGNMNVLRKSRGEITANTIVNIVVRGNRLICGDIREGITYAYFKEDQHRFIPFVDDTVSRWTTCSTMLDYDTTAGGDKFGNLFIVRCPESISVEVDDENRQAFILAERPFINGAPYRLELRAHYFVQDIPVSVQKTSLLAGGDDVLFWAGIQGTMGILVPFVSRHDVNVFNKLEVAMRTEDPPLGGRDHLAYRSYYAPVRCVIDGDLCERFLQLSYDKKQVVAAECDRSVSDIERKIQEMRTRVAY